jgi:hypothetical protein
MEDGILMLCVLCPYWEIPVRAAQNLKDDEALPLGWSMVLS